MQLLARDAHDAHDAHMTWEKNIPLKKGIKYVFFEFDNVLTNKAAWTKLRQKEVWTEFPQWTRGMWYELFGGQNGVNRLKSFLSGLTNKGVQPIIISYNIESFIAAALDMVGLTAFFMGPSHDGTEVVSWMITQSDLLADGIDGDKQLMIDSIRRGDGEMGFGEEATVESEEANAHKTLLVDFDADVLSETKPIVESEDWKPTLSQKYLVESGQLQVEDMKAILAAAG